MFKGSDLKHYEQIIEGKVYHFFCDNDSPTHHIKEVCSQLIGHMVGIEKSHAEQLAAEAKKKEPEEVEVEEIN